MVYKYSVFINNLFEALAKTVRKVLRDILNKYEVKVEKLVKENEKLAYKIDQLEQYSPRCSARNSEFRNKERKSFEDRVIAVLCKWISALRILNVVTGLMINSRKNRADVYKFVNYEIKCK